MVFFANLMQLDPRFHMRAGCVSAGRRKPINTGRDFESIFDAFRKYLQDGKRYC